VSESNIFFADASGTFLLNYFTGEWTEFSSVVSMENRYVACGLIRRQNGQREIVYTVQGRSQIFSLDGNKIWREGPPLEDVHG